jgi:hypothetical protein
VQPPLQTPHGIPKVLPYHQEGGAAQEEGEAVGVRSVGLSEDEEPEGGREGGRGGGREGGREEGKRV